MYVWSLPLGRPYMYDSSSALALISLLYHYYCLCTITFLALNGILVPAYIPCSLALHCISKGLSMKSDID